MSEEKKPPGASLMDILRIPNFRLLWVGEGISLLGDQFYFIALPWLVLQLTGNSNAFAVGVVLSLNHMPRALFMLVGGALTDRFSPRAVMLGSNLARMGLVGILALLVLTGQIYLWMLYVFALSFGIADAFYYPAQTAIVPQILEKKAFQAGNALVQGTGMLAQAIGMILLAILLWAATIPEIRRMGLDTQAEAKQKSKSTAPT